MGSVSLRGLFRRVLPALATLALHAAAEAAPPRGTPVFIRLPPDALAVATGANGFVAVGSYRTLGAFHWMPASTTTDIGGLGAVDVSGDGKTIVGNALEGRLENAAVWTGGRTWRTLGPLRPGAQPCDALLTSAYGTNADGRVVVGLGWDGCGYARAFRWEEGTGMADLGSLSGRSTRANAVSGDGRVVVGWDTHPTGPRLGAKWVDGRQEMIRGPSGDVGEAHATNRDGSIIVGGLCDFTNPLGRLIAWTWTSAAGVTCHPVNPPDYAIRGVPYSAIMFGTSDDGRVIGGALTFGLDAESMVWFDGEPIGLRDYLRGNGIPDAFEGWINTGFIHDVSADGRTLVGYGAGPTTFQGFVVILPELDDR